MIVYTKGRTPDSAQDYVAPGKHQKLNIPVVVVVNHGSASASEIVTGAIQDHGRGIVVGETSWGKGLVQSVYTLPYGAGLALTTSKYYTPSGRNIQRDYSSFYDYYVADDSDASAAGEVPLKDRKQFHTDTGRVVYGGGGITPDVFVKPPTLTRTTQLLDLRSAIFNYGVEYVAKHPDTTKDGAVSAAMLEDFAQFAASKDVAPLADIHDALQKPVDRDYLTRAIKAEIVTAKFGYDASYPYRLEGDSQIAKAIDELPAAAKLETQAAEARAHGDGTTANAGSRAASNSLPKTQ